MTTAQPLNLITDTERLFRYPIRSTERLDSHSWFSFHHSRWERSEFRILADLEVKGAFLELICAAQKEGPVGTLPTSDVLLADAAKVSLELWLRLKARSISPLYGWLPCLCDNGKVRLYHKTVLETVEDALKGRLRWQENAEAERERKRLADLPRKILRAGGSERMAQDAAYVLQLDQYLLEHLAEGKNRTPKCVRKAMEGMEMGLVGPI